VRFLNNKSLLISNKYCLLFLMSVMPHLAHAQETNFEGGGDKSLVQAQTDCNQFLGSSFSNYITGAYSDRCRSVSNQSGMGYYHFFLVKSSYVRTVSYLPDLQDEPEHLSDSINATVISRKTSKDYRGKDKVSVRFTQHQYTKKTADGKNYCHSYYNSGCQVLSEYRYYFGLSCSSQGKEFFEGECISLPPAKNNNGDSEHNTCNPINIATGNKFFNQRDFLGRGVSPLKFSLFYNSNNDNGIWTHDYGQKILVESNKIDVRRENGQVLSFSTSGNDILGQSHRKEYLRVNNGMYELSLPNNTIEKYSLNGQLLSIRYPSGIVHEISYSDIGSIIVTRNNTMLILEIEDDKVVQATWPDESIILYSYEVIDNLDRLKQVVHADGSTRTYLYENENFPHYITGILDENNHRISSVKYDTQGRAISSEVGTLDSGIERTQIEYHEDGSRTLTNALGKQNTYHFTQFNGEYKMTRVEGHASQNCASANQAYTYDSNGFMASKTDWKGNVTAYVHNNRGLEISRTEASGTPQARTIQTEWHPTFNLRTKVNEPERETLLSYDANGRLTSQEVRPR
jgi:YD repeat-containing protein